MSEESTAHEGMMGISEKLHSFLEDRERSEIFLEKHLEFLKSMHRQQLQQIELQHQTGLESRILQNSLLSESTDSSHKTSGPQETPCNDGNSVKNRGGIFMYSTPKRSSSTPDLSTKMRLGKSFNPVMPQTRGSRRQDLLQAKDSRTSTMFEKEELDWAECQKQFHVAPVPEHVSLPLYDNIVSTQERMRQEGRQQRRELLLSMQRPFTFHQREQKKDRRQETATDKQSENSKLAGRKKAVPKAVTDPAISEHLKEEEKKRKIRIQTRALETLRASSAPIQSQAPRANDQQARTAQRTKSKALGFLEQRPSFRPVINAQVPDFDKQYQAFQRKLMETAEKREITLCQPFQLRTSTLQPRQSKSSSDQPNSTSKSSLKRSSSFGGLTSLSMDTLPTYITDAARKRSMAIRRSLELRDSQEQENAEWMKQHRMNSQAMSKAVAARAKAMDPHRSLKEVYQEKLKQHRQADQERVKDYKKELREMKARVTARPYLFEQVSQKIAKSDAERRYRTTLEQAGLDENFVRSKGEDGESQTSKNKDTDCDSDGDEHSFEREGSVEDEEGTEEESMKTKKEEVC